MYSKESLRRAEELADKAASKLRASGYRLAKNRRTGEYRILSRPPRSG